uniref:Cilia- and flagella-associated protein 97 n=1 Tax=Ornithodoros turicata TaxID=34597 RepID=A0A2R5L4H6_9ACAR
MSWKVGLGGTHDDLDLQGAIDVSFFDTDSKETLGCCSNLTNCEPTKSTSADLAGLGQKCHTRDSQPFPSQSNNFTGHPIGQHYQQETASYYSDFEMTKPTSFMLGDSQVTPVNTDRDMKDGSPVHRDDMGEDEVTSPNSSVSVTDSDGVSSLSEDSMEGLSESESITDVTPLHSPYMCDSPVPTTKMPISKLALPGSTNGRERADTSSGSDSDGPPYDTKRKNSVKLRGKVRLGTGTKQEDSVDLRLLVDAIRQLEAHQCDQTSSVRTRRCEPSSVAKGRKNMSFTNEEVQNIDRENQRLLKRILAQQNRPKPKFDTRTPSRLAPSAINRQRQQRQIEVENLALLKRIESAKPSLDMVPASQAVCAEFGGALPRARSHSLSLTRHRLASPSAASTTGKSVASLSGVSHFPHRQKHHSH